ncbi:RES family NAD+ phosphorylase [Jiella pelagia]|uniref:RES family NAD+ phosphorylase n=1 Tax=Jiella pelagia TaxID=2986949 RepID=A0ABY7C1X2_9HYPH|nr:RES family NAD+ phosphorylase [Jiella pelagia]WAP70064.1 RES family NAD+ phosphorylase [Jiella pelagia]
MQKPDGLRWITDKTPHEFLIPEETVGPFLSVTFDDIESFNDALSDEIDSDFASSICCCDLCFDKFQSYWPDVAFRNMDFQTQSMDVFYAVDNTRLPGIWSPAEISTLRHFVRCPRCNDFAVGYIWIYEHLFSDIETIEQEIDELLTIGNDTPFLLLEHPFAQRVLATIRSAVESASTLAPGVSMFRARLASSIISSGQDPNSIAAYAPPPSRLVGEGRFNHAGTPMFYLASTREVAGAEIGTPESPCYIAELVTSCPLVFLDLVDIEEDTPSFEVMAPLAESALLAAPLSDEGWLKRQYVFSRFVADCARAAGFEAIRYRSTKRTCGNNLVLLAPPLRIEEIVTLKSVEQSVGLPADRRL